jgi:hypothetical protein
MKQMQPLLAGALIFYEKYVCSVAGGVAAGAATMLVFEPKAILA